MVARYTHFSRVFVRILSRLVATCRVPVMWLFRSGSQDSEHSAPANTSRSLQPDIKTVKTNLEKLRGYHDLAKVKDTDAI